MKVDRSIRSGSTRLSFTMWIVLSTRVKVFPDPGPAITNKGPSSVSIAFFCCELAFCTSLPPGNKAIDFSC